MKRIFALLSAVLLLSGCAPQKPPAQVVATTLPVYEFTNMLCENTDIRVQRLITEEVSCLHNYSLQVDQMRALESAELIVLTGLGFEDFVLDAASEDADILATIEIPHEPKDAHNQDHDHAHGKTDPHIWLMPHNALIMCNKICDGLCLRYPHYTDTFRSNLVKLEVKIHELETYGTEQLQALSCRKLITFHDGFANLAEAFGLTILRSIEEESGSEASAAQLKELTLLIEENQIPAVFTEKNGSCSAAQIISRETGAAVYELDMALSGDSYFDAMYHNIDTLKEALE